MFSSVPHLTSKVNRLSRHKRQWRLFHGSVGLLSLAYRTVEKDGKRTREPVLDRKGQPIKKEEYVGRFKQKSIEVCKSVMVNEIIQDRENNLKINQIIRGSIIEQKKSQPFIKDKDFAKSFLKLYEKMPDCDRKMWVYNSNKMFHLRPEIDQLTTEDSLIRCIEKDPDDIELPLDSNAKEFLSIITTNKEARKYTDADRLMEIREWKSIIESLRKNGVDSITFPTQDGDEQELAIKGEATRDIIAQATGLSRGSINKFEKVEIQGSEAVKKAVMEGEASIHTAAEMVDLLSKEEQEELLNGTKEKVTVEMVRKKAEDSIQEGLITPQRFQKDTKEILKILKKEKIILNEQEQKKYDDCISTLKNLLCEKES